MLALLFDRIGSKLDHYNWAPPWKRTMDGKLNQVGNTLRKINTSHSAMWDFVSFPLKRKLWFSDCPTPPPNIDQNLSIYIHWISFRDRKCLQFMSTHHRLQREGALRTYPVYKLGDVKPITPIPSTIHYPGPTLFHPLSGCSSHSITLPFKAMLIPPLRVEIWSTHWKNGNAIASWPFLTAT